MPSYVLKASPDEDLYGIYSTVVDAFVFTGTRDETRQHLLYEDGVNGKPDERLDRADRNGTSCKIGAPDFWYGWAEESISIGEGPGCGELARKDLSAYLRAIENDDDAAAAALVATEAEGRP